MLSPSAFKTRFPEFSGIPDSRIEVYINLANLQMDEASWGDYYTEGLSNLSAHLLVMGIRQSSGADANHAVASRSVGDVSVSFAVPSSAISGSAFYSSTSYGQMYTHLVQLAGSGVFVG